MLESSYFSSISDDTQKYLDSQQTSDSNNLTQRNYNDCLNKILSANQLEKIGDITGAISLYQEVIELDQEGTYKAIAQKAIELLELAKIKNTIPSFEFKEQSEIKTSLPFHQRLLKRFYDLPIQTKQLTVLLTSELICVLGLVGVGATLIITNGQSQLVNQAKSELKVAEINYNIKVDQMELGFRGQADNIAIIEAAEKAKADGVVLNILANEIWKQKIEFATLVDRQGKIIGTGNIKVSDQKFDPQGLVTKALKSGTQSKVTEIIPYNELAKENPLFANFRAQDIGVDPATKPNFLIRYAIIPIRNGQAQIVGALIAGDVVKSPIVSNTVAAFDSGYSAIYLYTPTGQFTLATSQLKNPKGKLEENIALSNNKLLQQAIAAQGNPVTGTVNLNNRPYTIAAKALFNSGNQPIAVLVRGTSHQSLNTLITQSLELQGISAILALLVSAGLGVLLGQALLKPLKQLIDVTTQFSTGNREVRAEKFAEDEMGELATNFNTMADSIITSETKLAQQAYQQETEAEKQRQAKEKLQQDVIQMLLEIEEAQTGNLTIEAKVSDGVVGSVADAFNTTIRSIHQLVSQVQTVSHQVGDLASAEEKSVHHLSEAAINQAQEINQVFQGVAQMNTSIQIVANSTHEAAKIARLALEQAQEGDQAMVHTVNTIQSIRSSVAGTAKKLKQLAESSQEISQIVTIISSISEKTNVLAFNASIEAARAGEHGEGFRGVAEEVSRLAVKVTEATQDIQELVETIQEDTVKVLRDMENSTAEVVTGTQLVRQTQETLQGLAATSQQIDQYLQAITNNTTAQTGVSQQINKKMEGVATIAQETSSEAQNVVASLQGLVQQVKVLQLSVSRFRL